MHTRTIEPLVVHNVVERVKLLILHFLESLVDVIIPALMTVEGTPRAEDGWPRFDWWTRRLRRRRWKARTDQQSQPPRCQCFHRHRRHHQGYQMTQWRRQLGSAERRSSRLRAYRRICRAGLWMPLDAPERIVACSWLPCFMLLFRHTSFWRSILSLQGFKILFQRRISSQPTAHKNRFLHAICVGFLTVVVCMQKLTSQIEVESHTSQTPSKIVCEGGKQAHKYSLLPPLFCPIQCLPGSENESCFSVVQV